MTVKSGKFTDIVKCADVKPVFKKGIRETNISRDLLVPFPISQIKKKKKKKKDSYSNQFIYEAQTVKISSRLP